MSKSFQHGTANRAPRYRDEFDSIMAQSNEMKEIKARLNELLTDDERESTWNKINEGNPGLQEKQQRILNMINLMKLRLMQQDDPIGPRDTYAINQSPFHSQLKEQQS